MDKEEASKRARDTEKDDNPSDLKKATKITHESFSEGGPLDGVIEGLRKDHRLLLAVLYFFDSHTERTHAHALGLQVFRDVSFSSYGLSSTYYQLYTLSHSYFLLCNGIPLEHIQLNEHDMVSMLMDGLPLSFSMNKTAHRRWAARFDEIDSILRPLCFDAETGSPLYNYGVYELIRRTTLACIEEYAKLNLNQTELIKTIWQYLELMETKLMIESAGVATMSILFPKIELKIPLVINGKQYEEEIQLSFLAEKNGLVCLLNNASVFMDTFLPFTDNTSQLQGMLLDWVKDASRIANWTYTLAQCIKDKMGTFESVRVERTNKMMVSGMPESMIVNQKMSGVISIFLHERPDPVLNQGIQIRHGTQKLAIWITSHVTKRVYGPIGSIPREATEDQPGLILCVLESLLNLQFKYDQ